jgi:phosphoribosylglycinamide formyltransferase-1
MAMQTSRLRRAFSRKRRSSSEIASGGGSHRCGSPIKQSGQAFKSEVVDRQDDQHAGRGVNEAFNRGGHGRLVDRARCAGYFDVEMPNENERTLPERRMQQRIVRGLEGGDPGGGVGHDPTEPGHSGIRVGPGLVNELVQREAGLCGGVLEDGQLPARLGEMSSQALQILLHEFRALGKQDGADHAQNPIDHAIEEAEESLSKLHEVSVVGEVGKASRWSAGGTQIMRASRERLELTDAMRVVIMGSGRGSNAEAILLAQQDGRLGKARVVQILSDKPDAGILALGARFGVPARFVDPAPFKTKLEGEGEKRFIAIVQECAPDLVVLAGFMRVLKPGFLNAFSGKIINLHPSLLPAYPGLDGIGQAFRAGVSETGCTVHYVTPDVDAGEIIEQVKVPIGPGETLDSLTAKVHAAEHRLLPSVIARLSNKT